MLVYEPDKRFNAVQALAHSYFDELRDEKTKLPNGNSLRDLFNFTKGILN